MVKLQAILTGAPPSVADAIATVEAIAAVLPLGMRSMSAPLKNDGTVLAVRIVGSIEVADVPALKAAIKAVLPAWLKLKQEPEWSRELAAGPRAAWAAAHAAILAANVTDVQNIYLAITASAGSDTLKDAMRALVLDATGKVEIEEEVE